MTWMNGLALLLAVLIHTVQPAPAPARKREIFAMSLASG